MRHASALLILALLAPGCAHTQYVRWGDTHARTGNWERAVSDYETAQQLAPGSRRVAKRLEHAIDRLDAQRQEQVREAIVDADAALRRGDYASVVVQVERALAILPDDETVQEVAWEAALQLDALAEDRLAEQAWLDGYGFALLAVRLSPGEATLLKTLVKARSEVLREAVALAERREFAEAERLAKAVRESEPEAVSAGVLEAIHARWADDLRAQATRDEARGRRASALVGYAHAADLAGGDSDRTARDRLAAALADDYRFGVRWTGAGTDAAMLEDAVASRVAGDPRLDWDVPDGVLRIDVIGVDHDVQSTTRTTTASHRYVAGTRWVDNPRYAEAARDLSAADIDLLEAEHEVVRWEDEVAAAEHAVDWVRETRWIRASDSLERADAVLDAARAAETAAEVALAEAEAVLAQAQADEGWSGTPVDQLEAAAAAKRRALERARAARQVADTAERTARSEFESVDRDLKDLWEHAEDARRRLARERDHLRVARRSFAEAGATLAATPELVQEDVWETFAYPVEEVTRTATAVVTVSVRTASGTGRRTHTASASTKDSHHEAYPDVGVAADPLRLPRSDAALIAEATDALAAPLAATVTAARDEHYASLWARGRVASDTESATALYLAGALLDPEATPETATDWLRRTWGIDVLALLRG